jgi:hypothetical protein
VDQIKRGRIAGLPLERAVLSALIADYRSRDSSRLRADLWDGA